jgi:hypothetical protein
LKDKIHLILSDKLYEFNVTEPVPNITKVEISDNIVVVRTFHVENKNPSKFLIHTNTFVLHFFFFFKLAVHLIIMLILLYKI